MNLLYTGAAVVLVAAVAGGSGYLKGAAAGRAEIRQEWDQEKARAAEEYAKAQAAAREKEQQLQAQADQLREETNAKLKEANTRAAALADSLRKRPERTAAPSGAAETAVAGQGAAGCTGAILPREDATFLAGEAARADQLRAALAQCYAQYEAVRKQ